MKKNIKILIIASLWIVFLPIACTLKIIMFVLSIIKNVLISINRTISKS